MRMQSVFLHWKVIPGQKSYVKCRSRWPAFRQRETALWIWVKPPRGSRWQEKVTRCRWNAAKRQTSWQKKKFPHRLKAYAERSVILRIRRISLENRKMLFAWMKKVTDIIFLTNESGHWKQEIRHRSRECVWLHFWRWQGRCFWRWRQEVRFWRYW